MKTEMMNNLQQISEQNLVDIEQARENGRAAIGFYCLYSPTENFLRAAGIKPDEIFVGGFSLSPATATAIENGYVDLVSEMQPYLLGYLSVAQIVFTKKYGFTGLELDTGGGLVHKDNIRLVAPLAQKGIR